MSFQTQESELGLLSKIILGIIEDVTGLSSDTLQVDSQFSEIRSCFLIRHAKRLYSTKN